MKVVEIVEAGKDDGGVDVRYIQSAERGEATKEMAYLDELGPHTEPKATRTRTRTATRTRGKPAETAPETQADNGADDSGMVTLQNQCRGSRGREGVCWIVQGNQQPYVRLRRHGGCPHPPLPRNPGKGQPMQLHFESRLGSTDGRPLLPCH